MSDDDVVVVVDVNIETVVLKWSIVSHSTMIRNSVEIQLEIGDG